MKRRHLLAIYRPAVGRYVLATIGTDIDIDIDIVIDIEIEIDIGVSSFWVYAGRISAPPPFPEGGRNRAN